MSKATGQESAHGVQSASTQRKRSQVPNPRPAAPEVLQHALANPAEASPDVMLQLQRTYGNQALQRAVRHRPAIGLQGGPVDGDLQRDIDGARGGGRPLDARAGGQIGAALGADFSGVRVHTDARADALNRSLSARAFTTGSDIFFSRGAYSPGSSGGKQLLAHELTHVVQQGGGRSNHLQAKLTVGRANDAYEDEADAVANRVMRHLSLPPAGETEGPQQDATRSPVIARSIAINHVAQPGKIQRAVGFEFQTGWGLVRSVPDTHVNRVGPRADDPNPETQADYEDEDIAHPNLPAPLPVAQAPIPLTRKQRVGNWFKRKLHVGTQTQPVVPPPITPPPAPDQHGNVRESDTQYKATQSNDNIVTRAAPGRKHLRVFKGQVLKKYGAHVKLTVDDASTPLGAELEWVIDPPLQEALTPDDVADVMDELGLAVNALMPFQNRESFTLDEATHSVGDSSIELQPGIKGNDSRSMKAAAQMTGGVTMAKLHAMFREVGMGATQGVDPTTVGKSDLDAGANSLKGASGGVGVNAAKIGDAVVGSPELKGLVSFIARYLAMGRGGQGQNEYKSALNYAKAGTVFLARTSFAKMFNMLPDNERLQYSGDPDSFVALVSAALGNNAYNMDALVLERGIKNDATQKDGTAADIHHQVNVTRRAWIKGIAEGKDLMSSKQPETRVAGYAALLESMGNLGNKTDKVGTDAGDDRTNHTGVVMEFRGNTDPQLPAAWKPYAVNAFKYIKFLNNR